MTRRVLVREIEGVEQYLVEQVELHGGMCEKHVSPGRRGPPDRICIWPRYGYAQIHFVETKTIMVNGRPTPLKPWQIRDHAARRKLGCVVRVLYTKEDVDRYVSRCKTSANVEDLLK